MECRIKKEEYIANGFRVTDAYVYVESEEEVPGKKKEIKDYCMSNRLYVRQIYTDIGSKEWLRYLIYGIKRKKEVPDRIVIYSPEMLGEDRNEVLTNRIEIGIRGYREIEFVKGDDPDKEFADYYIRKHIENIGSRNLEIKKQKALNGGFFGGRVPYGYYCMNGKLFQDNYESFVVKFIFYRLTQGCSEYGISKELNLRGFHNRKGNDFLPGSIHSIASRKRFYQGYGEVDGVEVKGSYIPLLEETDELISEAFVKRHFNKEIEEKIIKSKERAKKYGSIEYSVSPFLVTDKRGTKRGRIPKYEKPI